MPPVAAVIAAVASSITVAAAALAAAAPALAAIGAFLATPFGALVLGIGLQLISNFFIKKPGFSNVNAPSIEAAKINVRIAEPERWLSGGSNRMGGGVVFAEFDTNGNFWYVVIHSDSNHSGIQTRYFDNQPITLDGSGYVNENDFSLTSEGDSYEGSGTQVKYFQVFSTTYTEANPTPPAVSELIAAFPTIWTTDHKLVGTSYSVVKIKPVAPEHRYKVFRWRGPIGVGEPSFSIVANWSNVYDPREVSHDINDPTTFEFSRNPVLLWAWFRTHRYGRNKSTDSINWDMVEAMADICDISVTDISLNSAAQYVCDVSIPESTERTNGEHQILLSCDAQLVFDDDGKCWPRVGYYYTTPIKLVRNRDIVAMESVEANNGETITQGVIVRYIDPEADYTAQPCAPYVNPLYYVDGETPKYIIIDALTIQNHRQAMQLAKSISKRSQPAYKLVPTTGLRGLRARQHRIVNLLYDNNFSGDHEIVTPVEVDESGAFCGFGCVPIDEFRWTLLVGEEKAKTTISTVTLDYSPLLPTNVVIEFTNNRIEASFDTSPRPDWFYVFEYQLKNGAIPDDNSWLKMTLVTDDDYSYSGSIEANADYFVRWRTSSSGGKASDYVDPVITINTTSLILTGTPILVGEVGVVYTSFTISVTGGTSPYIFTDTYERLPNGLSVDSATGVVSGTPTSTGTYSNISILVQDSGSKNNLFPEFEIVVS